MKKRYLLFTLLTLCVLMGCQKVNESQATCSKNGCMEAEYRDGLCADHYVEKGLMANSPTITSIQMPELTPTNTPRPTSTPTPTTDPDIYKNWSGFRATDTKVEQNFNGDWYFVNDNDLINSWSQEYIQDFWSVVKDDNVKILTNSYGNYSLLLGYTEINYYEERCNIYLIEDGQLRRLNLSKLFGSDINVEIEISQNGNSMIVENSSGLFWYDLIRDEVYQLAYGNRYYEYIMSQNGKTVLYNYSTEDNIDQLWIFNGGVSNLFSEMDSPVSWYTLLAISDDARSVWYLNDGDWSVELYLNYTNIYSGINVHYNFNSTASECFFADYYASDDGGNIYGFVKSGDYEPSLLSLTTGCKTFTNYYWEHNFKEKPTGIFPDPSAVIFTYETDSLRYWPILFVDEYNCIYQFNFDNMPCPEFLFQVDGKFIDNLSYRDFEVFFVRDSMPCYADVYSSPIQIYEMMPEMQEPLFNYYIDEIINSYDIEHNIYRTTDHQYYVINDKKNGFTEIPSLEPYEAGYLSEYYLRESDIYDSENGVFYDVSILKEKGIDLYLNLDAYCKFFWDENYGDNFKLPDLSRSENPVHSYNSLCAFYEMNSWAECDWGSILTESGLTLYEKYPEACGNYVPLTNEMAEDLRYITRDFNQNITKWLEFLVQKPVSSDN